MSSIIPKVNISKLINNGLDSDKSSATIKKIKKACLKIGFFEITGHGINPKLIKST